MADFAFNVVVVWTECLLAIVASPTKATFIHVVVRKAHAPLRKDAGVAGVAVEGIVFKMRKQRRVRWIALTMLDHYRNAHGVRHRPCAPRR